MPENVTLQESSFYIHKLIITHQEPIEGMKVLLLPGYESNIPGYQVNTVITLPRGN